jgi:hypothetical protein
LEIGDVFHFRIFARKKTNAFLHLLAYGFMISGVLRTESLIITIRATAPAFASVAIGTGKSRINGNFLHFKRESRLQEPAEILVGFSI